MEAYLTPPGSEGYGIEESLGNAITADQTSTCHASLGAIPEEADLPPQSSQPTSSAKPKLIRKQRPSSYRIKRSDESIPPYAVDYSVSRLETSRTGVRKDLQVTFYPRSSPGENPQERQSCGVWPPMNHREVKEKLECSSVTIRNATAEPGKPLKVAELPHSYTCLSEHGDSIKSWPSATEARREQPSLGVTLAKRNGAVLINWPNQGDAEGDIRTYLAHHANHRTPTLAEVQIAARNCDMVQSERPMPAWLRGFVSTGTPYPDQGAEMLTQPHLGRPYSPAFEQDDFNPDHSAGVENYDDFLEQLEEDPFLDELDLAAVHADVDEDSLFGPIAGERAHALYSALSPAGSPQDRIDPEAGAFSTSVALSPPPITGPISDAQGLEIPEEANAYSVCYVGGKKARHNRPPGYQVTFYSLLDHKDKGVTRSECGKWPPASGKDIAKRLGLSVKHVSNHTTEIGEAPDIRLLKRVFTAYNRHGWREIYESAKSAAEAHSMYVVEKAYAEGAVSIEWQKDAEHRDVARTWHAHHCSHLKPTLEQVDGQLPGALRR